MQFLSETETNEILSVLKGGVDKTFESVTLSVGLLFRREIDKFKACCGLVFALLEDFLDSRQRLFALYALLELHRDKAPSVHPFWEFLLTLGSHPKTPVEEMELIHLFIVQNRGNELLRRSVSDFLSMVYSTSLTVQHTHQNELQKLILKLPFNDKGIGSFAKLGVHRVLLNGVQSSSIERDRQSEIFNSFTQEIGINGFEPSFVRPMPPITKLMDCELQWLEPKVMPMLMWDSGEDHMKEELIHKIKEYLSKATVSPLLLHEQQEILHDLKENPNILFHCDLDPIDLPSLVENTPQIATTILQSIVPSSLGVLFLSKLATLEMSLHSIEVVNDLVTSISLPSEIVHEYISNCIASCNAIEDFSYQHRQVRLLCVFIQSLTISDTVDIADLIHEVQAFCVDHARIREASELFKTLKNKNKT